MHDDLTEMELDLPFTLTFGEQNHAVWRKIEKHYEGRLDRLRSRLEGDLGEEETWKMRGRIKELRALLSIASNDAIESEAEVLF